MEITGAVGAVGRKAARERCCLERFGIVWRAESENESPS